MGPILCIQPWIYDFAAYDMWVEPIGLLRVANALRRCGYQVHLLDCLDRAHPELLKRQGLREPDETPYGCGHYHKERVDKPKALRHVPRRYSRYGLPLDIFDEELARVGEPDAVLVGSTMTYWYPGVQEVIRRVKRCYPRVPVLLGGLYATLCHEHAMRHSGADHVVRGEGILATLRWLEASNLAKPAEPMMPAHDLVRRLNSAALLTSRGCPMHCTYCASDLIAPGFQQYPPEHVLDEIEWCHELGARHFAFYDDALLVRSAEHILPILEGIRVRRLPVDFHTPNAIHAAHITEEIAHALREANFRTLRMGLETSSPSRQRETGGKVTNSGFQNAVRALRKAGFGMGDIAAYVLVGLPGQTLEEARKTVRFAHDQGCPVKLAFYSPIPGTQEWIENARPGRLSTEDDPLLHNNTLLPYRDDGEWNRLEPLKRWVQEENRRVQMTA